MAIIISLPPETEEKLRARAAANGQTVDSYVRQLLEREVIGSNGGQGAATASPSPAGPHPGPTLDEVLAHSATSLNEAA